MLTKPFPLAKRHARAHTCAMGLHFEESQAAWVADGETVRDALLHPELRVRPPAQPVPPALEGSAAGEVFALLVRMNDGEFHARHRPAVLAGAMRWTRDEITVAAQAAARDLWGRVGVDDWLWQVPVQAMARLLHVAAAELDATVTAVAAFVRAIAPGADARAIADAEHAVRALMAQGASAGLDRVLSANRIALMQQALDATSGLIGNVLVAWQRDRGALTRDFVVRVSRQEPAVLNTRRFAAADLVLAGQTVRQGQAVLVLIAQAGLPFGAGAHHCPGESLAIDIATAAVTAVDVAACDWTPTGYRPLANARVPMFGAAAG
jgi:cytochrome P450